LLGPPAAADGLAPPFKALLREMNDSMGDELAMLPG
jgi:hypothetical protein